MNISISGLTIPLGCGEDINIAQYGDTLYFGFLINTLMCGFMGLQSWNYFTSKNLDGWVVKWMVAIVIVASAATTCINIQIAHFYLISHFGNIRNLFNTTV
jgi:hypothetical protein